MPRQYTCPECGQIAGGHFTGCPEMPDEPETAPEIHPCRCCGMDKPCTVERAGPICEDCAP